MQDIIQKAREALATYTQHDQQLAEAREKRDRLSKASAKPITQSIIRDLSDANAAIMLLEGREGSLDGIVAPVIDECNELIMQEVEALKRLQLKLDLAALRTASEALIRRIARGEVPAPAEFDLRNSPEYRAEEGMRNALGIMGTGGVFLARTHTRADIVRALEQVIHLATNVGVARARSDAMVAQLGRAA